MKNINILDLCFNKTWKKVLLMLLSIVFLNFLVSVTTDFNLLGNLAKVFYAGPEDEVRSVEILSDKDQGPGSWKIEKSARWIKGNEAEITFNVSSKLKLVDKPKDIILVLDTSESMLDQKNNKAKIEKVKEDAKDLSEAILSNSNNKIALVSFNSVVDTLINFTNDTNVLKSEIDNLTAKSATNYYIALSRVLAMLEEENYESTTDRDLVILFLSDGYPILDTPNEGYVSDLLREKYSNLVINAVQYEMGSSFAEEIIRISDHQYNAYIENLQNNLFAASTAFEFYEKFEVLDFINDNDFEVNSMDDISASQGSIELIDNKITWKVSEFNDELEHYSFMSGYNATLKIKAKLLDNSSNKVGLYKTNEKESIIYKLGDLEEKVKNSNESPILYNGYDIVYEANAPLECSIKDEKETHSVLEVINIKKDGPTCSGYQFKGWELITSDAKYLEQEYEEGKTYKINDTSFKMPWKKITLKGTWSKLNITKSMSGTINENKPIALIDRIKDNAYDETIDGIPIDNIKSKFVSAETGIHFGNSPSDTNGRGIYIRAGTELGAENFNGKTIYYYRGDVNYNNIIFANFCWKIVRTTETGGIKLVYAGNPTEDNMCNNTGSTLAISDRVYFNWSAISSPLSYIGYMYGKLYPVTRKIIKSFNLAYNSHTLSDDVIYYFTKDKPQVNGKEYILTYNDALTGTWSQIKDKLKEGDYYTCSNATSQVSNCTFVYHYIGADDEHAYAFIDYSYGAELGHWDGNVYIAENIEEVGENKYRLVNPESIKESEWLANYLRYDKWYICEDWGESECLRSEMKRITSVFPNGANYTSAHDLTFGNDVVYNEETKEYILLDTEVMGVNDGWGSKFYTKHYTCFEPQDKKCKNEVYYVFNGEYETGWLHYIKLNGEKNIDEVFEKVFANEKSSGIKNTVDSWYSNNIENEKKNLHFEKYLEDTVWCNNREISSYAGWKKDNSNLLTDLIFDGNKIINYNSNPQFKEEVVCPNVRDRFTKNSLEDGGNGNGKLQYPIGLLTADELTAAGLGNYGYSKDSYLNSGAIWTMTPSRFINEVGSSNSYSYIFRTYGNGQLAWGDRWNSQTHDYLQARPSISLKSDVKIWSLGTGTPTSPFIVVEN